MHENPPLELLAGASGQSPWLGHLVSSGVPGTVNTALGGRIAGWLGTLALELSRSRLQPSSSSVRLRTSYLPSLRPTFPTC